MIMVGMKAMIRETTKDNMLKKGCLSRLQNKKEVVYFIFKGQEIVYVGLTNNFQRRYKQHFSSEFRKYTPNKVLYKSMLKYGESEFEMYIAYQFSYRDEAAIKEIELINNLQMISLARYNIDSGEKNYSSNDIEMNRHERNEYIGRAHTAINDLINKAFVDVENYYAHPEDLPFIDISANNGDMYGLLQYTVKQPLSDMLKKPKIRTIKGEKFEIYIDYNLGKLVKASDSSLKSQSRALREEGILKVASDVRRLIMEIMDLKPVDFTNNSYVGPILNDVITYIYDESTNIERYVWFLYLGGLDEYEIMDVVDISEYEFRQCLENIIGVEIGDPIYA